MKESDKKPRGPLKKLIKKTDRNNSPVKFIELDDPESAYQLKKVQIVNVESYPNIKKALELAKEIRVYNSKHEITPACASTYDYFSHDWVEIGSKSIHVDQYFVDPDYDLILLSISAKLCARCGRLDITSKSKGSGTLYI